MSQVKKFTSLIFYLFQGLKLEYVVFFKYLPIQIGIISFVSSAGDKKQMHTKFVLKFCCHNLKNWAFSSFFELRPQQKLKGI